MKNNNPKNAMTQPTYTDSQGNQLSVIDILKQLETQLSPNSPEEIALETLLVNLTEPDAPCD